MADAAAGIIPPGTVVAYAGNLNDFDVNIPVRLEVVEGWLLCNGAELSVSGHERLFAVLQHAHGGSGQVFRLPDYRGFFLRGVDRGAGRDPDSNARFALHVGGNSGNRVGSVQQGATELPGTPFRTDVHPPHRHEDPTWNGEDGDTFELATTDREAGGFDYGSQSAPTGFAGEHSHQVIGGGDQETRPKNVYVNYLIKT